MAPAPAPLPAVTDARRALPSVGSLLERADVQHLLARFPRSEVAEAVRDVLARLRAGEFSPPADPAAWAPLVDEALTERATPSLRPIINGTGVVLHTNLGRAPLAAAALDAITRTAAGAANLEYDLARGERGSRYDHCVAALCELTGAEDALVVNNCAAALVLALNTLSEGREAVISRGELIEIGGSFRVPEIMAKSGARLREVGTTNRTSAEDYRRALSPATGALIKVHRSNFEQRGFVAEASVRELADVAREGGVPLLYDFGSGLLMPLDEFGLHGEPVARDAVGEGASLVLMSGDKLLGGPQAGIIVGRREEVAACRRNPLCRALRVDKLTLAALEATLALYRDSERARREVPALAMLTASVAEVRRRAEALTRHLATGDVASEVIDSEASVGGGAFPTARIPSSAVAIAGNAMEVEARARHGRLPVIGRIERGRFLVDLRSVPSTMDSALGESLLASLGASSGVRGGGARQDGAAP